MISSHPESEEAAAAYLAPDKIVDELGSGVDGIVYSSSRATAVKVHQNDGKFLNELAVYRRL